MKSIYHAALASLLVTGLARGQAARAAFVTTIGKDTFALEQYARDGNVISGTWVVFHPPGVFAHDYHITLSPNGDPVRYTMKYSTPGAPTKPDFDSVIVEYHPDTATYALVLKDSTMTRRVAMQNAFPNLGQSWVGLELGLARLRRSGVDSGVIVLNEVTQPELGTRRLPVKFFGADSVMIGSNRALISADGSLLGMTAGRLTIHRVPSLDMPSLVKGFVDAFAPRVAALAAAAAARVPVAVPATQLDKLVGQYSLNTATSLTIRRDGDHLVLTLPGGKLDLLAQSPTQFFVRKPDLVLVFDVDQAGVATAVTVIQGEGKQHAVKTSS